MANPLHQLNIAICILAYLYGRAIMGAIIYESEHYRTEQRRINLFRDIPTRAILLGTPRVLRAHYMQLN